jgi:HK97 family phage portal protein
MLNRLVSNGEERAISFQSIWGAGDSLAWQSNSGASVTPDSSLTIAAFYGGVSLISNAISTLPMDCYIRKNGQRVPFRPKPEWVIKPDLDIASTAHWQQVVISILVWGNSYTRVFRDKRTGEVVNLVALDPTLVDVTRGKNGRKVFRYQGEEGKVLTSDEIIHITDMLMPGAVKGKGRVDALKENFGLAIALESFAARFFGGGVQTSGIIEYPGNLSKEQAKALVEGFDSRHRGYRQAHRTGILGGGAKYVQTSTPNDANQFLQSREYAVLDVCRVLQIPPHMLGITNGSQARASVEQLAIDFTTHALRPVVEKIERAYSDLLPNQAFIKFNLDALIRADFLTRMQGYSIATTGGWKSINDVRRLEDDAPVANGDQYRVPLANVEVTAADLVAEEKKIGMLQKLVASGFKPEEALAALGLPAIGHTGVPTNALQPVASIDPNDPASVYEVQ